jgi:hypothetical protein
MDILKRQIAAPPGWMLRDYSAEQKGSWKGTPGFGGFPLKWIHDAEKLCAFHNCKFQLLLSQTYPYDWGSFHAGSKRPNDPRRITIYVGKFQGKQEDQTQKDCFISSKTFVSILAHELAHAIQWNVYGHPRTHISGYRKLLSANLAFEQEACRLAFFIWKKLMSDRVPGLTTSFFRSYDKLANQLFLLQTDSKLVDDLGLSKKV